MASLKTRKSGGWEVRERMSDGTVKPHSVGKKKGLAEAKRIQAEANVREQERKIGQRSDQGPHGMRFVAFAEEYLPLFGDRYPRSVGKTKLHLKHLLPYFGELNMNADFRMWERIWEKYKGDRLEKVAQSTLHGEFATLKAMLEEACSNRLTSNRYSSRNPLAGVKFTRNVGKRSNPKKRYVFNESELKAIYSVASPRMAAVWRLMANTGIRRGELLQLPKRLVMADEMEIRHAPEEGLFTKTDSSRVVPLSAVAQDAVRTLRKASMDSDLLVPFVDQWALSKTFTSDRKAAGVVDGTLHSLRHTFISNLLNEKSVPLPVVMELVGHTKIETTMGYVKTLGSQLKQAVEGLAL